MFNANLAPIVLFVYNRPWHTRQTLEALMANEFADVSQLIVYSDGPKDNATVEQLNKIIEVRKLIREKRWCGHVEIFESDKNIGLDASIIAGVTEILNKFDKLIVLEDDLIISEDFLDFMNRSLKLYENEKRVMHIAGHSFPLFRKKNGIYFLKYISPWGWATWADRWKYFEKDAAILYKKLEQNKVNWTDFNCGYGNEFKSLLLYNIVHCQNNWDIRWHTSVYLNNGLSLMPKISLVRNIGFDEYGTHLNIINEILSNQKIALKNNFEFSPPAFNKKANLKMQFFYLKNVVLKRMINKLLKKLYWRFYSIRLGKAK